MTGSAPSDKKSQNGDEVILLSGFSPLAAGAGELDYADFAIVISIHDWGRLY
jgi:hypothetical protein